MGRKEVLTIRRSIVELLGCPYRAAVLERMIYWTLHRLEWDATCCKNPKQKTEGWFRKTAQSLADELMGLVTRERARQILRQLAAEGLIECRQVNRRVFYYRANIPEIERRILTNRQKKEEEGGRGKNEKN
jgi:hypothetical protein